MQKNRLSNRAFNPSFSRSNRLAAAEYSAAPSDNRIKPGAGGRALISAGMLVLTVWAVSVFSDGGNAYSDTSAPQPVAASASMANIAFSHSENPPLKPPPFNRRVVCSPMGMYHWHRDCPLGRGVSVPHVSPVADAQRVTRREAELQNYHPCVYCAEIQHWRAHELISENKKRPNNSVSDSSVAVR